MPAKALSLSGAHPSEAREIATRSRLRQPPQLRRPCVGVSRRTPAAAATRALSLAQRVDDRRTDRGPGRQRRQRRRCEGWPCQCRQSRMVYDRCTRQAYIALAVGGTAYMLYKRRGSGRCSAGRHRRSEGSPSLSGDLTTSVSLLLPRGEGCLLLRAEQGRHRARDERRAETPDTRMRPDGGRGVDRSISKRRLTSSRKKRSWCESPGRVDPNRR